MAKLRMGLTISGAVSLGSYEGGALAALLVAAQQMNGALVIDAITGASAGAITALVSTYCLNQGTDPVAAMKAAWVDLPSLENLATHSPSSPLTMTVLKNAAATLLSGKGPAQPQAEAIEMALALCPLGGLGYKITSLTGSTEVAASTYLDWANFTFSPANTADDYAEAVPAALSSGANAVGFAPFCLKRSEKDIETMKANGVTNPPTVDGTWYTDGGTIDNEPFGRLLDIVGDCESEDPRLIVLVHPTPASLPGSSRWSDFKNQPRWSPTAMHARGLQGDQDIYDDLRQLEKTNTRIVWVKQVADGIEAAVAAALQPLGAGADEARQGVATAVKGIIANLDQQHADLNAKLGRTASSRTGTDDATLAELLCQAIERATGLSGKQPIRVEIVSPALDTSGEPADELLAGERLGHFFGFLDVRFRQSDFALGYRNMTTWIDKTLRTFGLDAEVSEALKEVNARYEALAWDGVRYGNATWNTLSIHERFQIVGLGAHIAHIVEDDLRNWSEGFPVSS